MDTVTKTIATTLLSKTITILLPAIFFNGVNKNNSSYELYRQNMFPFVFKFSLFVTHNWNVFF